ncbi:MAG: acyl-CoA thioesterase II [Myxococcota bacterium]|nr:acyl-CoA thioesterase II [Myxococcota bacterium]
MAGEEKPENPRPRMLETTVPELIESLDLEEMDRDFYVGNPGEGRGRLFGGLVAAQSVVAAGRTVSPDAPLHSLHAYFLRPGSYGKPIRYTVDRIRDGRTFTTRRVVALQSGEAIFNLAASFAIPEVGISHQEPMRDTPAPEGLPEMNEVRARWFNEPPPDPVVTGTLEMRLVDDTDGDPSTKLEPVRNVWMRINGKPPEDPLLRTALLVHSSDRTLLGTALRPAGLTPGKDTLVTSLDHAFWLHHIPKLDDWFLYSSRSPMAHAGRALVRGAMYEPGGRRIASVTQEGLIRRRK